MFEHQNSYAANERDELFFRSPPPRFLLSLFMACISWKKTFEHCRRIACLFIRGYLCWERRFEGVCLRSSGSLSKHSFRVGWGFTASKTLRCHQEMVEHILRATLKMTVWSPPDATNVAFSSFQAFDVQLFIIRPFSVFTLSLKSTWSQNWLDVLSHSWSYGELLISAHFTNLSTNDFSVWRISWMPCFWMLFARNIQFLFGNSWGYWIKIRLLDILHWFKW